LQTILTGINRVEWFITSNNLGAALSAATCRPISATLRSSWSGNE
jgi:hypothetical protein